ncbi:MAG: hypothetical protein SFW66_05015 [Gammaproteobacteria bacterium]|nr:hypothetical protein [Gammaproteobacteria bacterium]
MLTKFFKKGSRSNAKKPEEDILTLLFTRIEQLSKELGKNDKKNQVILNKIQVFSILSKMLSSSTPHPEEGVDSIPQWRREQIFTAFLIDCHEARIERPLESLNEFRKFIHKEKTDSIVWLENFFGKELVENMMTQEVVNNDYFEDLLLERQIKSVNIEALRQTLGNESFHYMDFVEKEIADYFSGEQKVETEVVKMTLERLQNFFSDPKAYGGELARALNNWPTDQITKSLSGLTVTFKQHLEKLMEEHAYVKEIAPEEQTYLIALLKSEIEKLWKNLFDKIYFLIFDEIFDPQTGKLKSDITDMLKLVQDKLPEGHPGKTFDLMSENNQKSICAGLAGTLFTNIVFAELLNAPSEIMEKLANANESDKILIFQNINAAAGKVFNLYNNMFECYRQFTVGKTLSPEQQINVDLFQSKFEEWSRIRNGIPTSPQDLTAPEEFKFSRPRA